MTRAWARLDVWDWLTAVLCAVTAVLFVALWAPRPVAAEPGLRVAWETQARAAGHEVSDRRYAEHVITIVWGQAGAPVSEAMRVVHCETGGTYNTRAVGAAGERGLLQVHPIHRPTIAVLGMTWDDMFDPWANARFGLWLYQRQGWQPWSCARIVGVLR